MGLNSLTGFATPSILSHTKNVSSVPEPGQDWDCAVARVISSVNPEGGDWDADTLEGKGLAVGAVENLPQAEAHVQGSAVIVSAQKRRGVRLYSNTIPLDEGPATVSLKVNVEGERPKQVGIALINSQDGHTQFSSMLYNLLADGEIPAGERQVSITYELPSPGAVLLFQIVGPVTGRSTVTVDEIRVYPGTWPVDQALGPTRVSLGEDFEHGGALAGDLIIVATETRKIIPGGLGQCGLLRTQSGAEIRTAYLFGEDPLSPGMLPSNLEARGWVRRQADTDGSLALGLSNGHQTAVTIVPVRDLPREHWQMIRTGGMFTTADNPFIVVQLAGGPAEVLVDDIELHAPHDSVWFWDASYEPTATPSPVKARITPTPTPTETPTLPPTATPTPTPTLSPTPIAVISAPAAALPGVTSVSVEIVGVDGRAESRVPVVTLSLPSLDPVPGTAFISSASRAGIERSDNNPGNIEFVIPFELPDGYREPHLQFWASVEGKRAQIWLNDHRENYASMNRGTFKEAITFGRREHFLDKSNKLHVLLETEKSGPIAISFRMVVTFRE